jgi:CRP-like cAMP-binding protein
MLSSAFFSGLSELECIYVASRGHSRSFASGEVLFMQGQSSRHLVLIESGRVKMTQLRSNGNEVILWMNRSGDVIGALGESGPGSQSCSARAMDQCQALVWDYTKLRCLLLEFPQIRQNIGQILSDRLSELQERCREVASEKVAQHLALTLLRLIKQVGKPVREGVEISASRDELAQMTGTTLFTISRILSRWGEKGFVLPRREAVFVVDPERLPRTRIEEE